MIEGRCHCGAVRWIYRGTPDRATVCTCSVCRRYGAIWAYGDLDRDVTVAAAPDAGGTYLTADREIDFHHCRTCGCVTDWTSTVPDGAGRSRIAVNLRLADPASVAAIPLRRFDGADRWTELPAEGHRVADLLA